MEADKGSAFDLGRENLQEIQKTDAREDLRKWERKGSSWGRPPFVPRTIATPFLSKLGGGIRNLKMTQATKAGGDVFKKGGKCSV